MSLGPILIGIAVTMITLAYIARPFRHTNVNPDDIVETWIKQHSPTPTLPDTPTPTHTPTPTLPHSSTSPLPNADTQVNFCPQCGRRVQPDHRFCPGCGYRLPVEETEA